MRQDLNPKPLIMFHSNIVACLKWNVWCQEAKEKFQQLQKVISILGDAEKRALYDETGITDDDVSTSFVLIDFLPLKLNQHLLNLLFPLRHWLEMLQTIFKSTSEQCTRRYASFYINHRLILSMNLQWLANQYFYNFPQVTEADIEEFEANYRGSDSEKKDLKDLYTKYKGNMNR